MFRHHEFSGTLRLFSESDDTIHGCAAALRANATSCVELLDRCLARIDEWETSVHAWVSIDQEAARQTAHERDRELAIGHDRGPLHGIPLGIKDIFDVAGHVTAAGSEAWSGHDPKRQDCAVVSRLRAAGAIILGKTVTTQFACFDPPVTRNPWNTSHTPGGSSSGSAAAVATGMCLGAIGSQTGGSITRPSTYCGIAGCKPSFGSVSLRGVVPVAEHLDHPGPMARCVTDLAILLDIIRDTPDGALTNSAAVIPPRVGWVHGLFDELSDDDARSAVTFAIDALSAAGAPIIDIDLPGEFDSILAHHAIIMAVEAAQTHHDHFAANPDDYSSAVKGLIERGMATPRSTFAAALDHQQKLCRDVGNCFRGVDVLICPATTGTAPDLSTTGSPAMNSPWSYTGLPTVSMPAQCAANGLPLGVQLVGRIRNDSTLLDSAIWCESKIAADFKP
ncbi:MAG: amidase [Fuerstiella sp.]|nr:amidase [Fuerstiella sp.]